MKTKNFNNNNNYYYNYNYKKNMVQVNLKGIFQNEGPAH